MVLATALFGKPAFRNLICNGLVLAEDGKKMSKSLKNYPSPMEVINDYGAVETSKCSYFFGFVICSLGFACNIKMHVCFPFLIMAMTSIQTTILFTLLKHCFGILLCWIGCLAVVPYKLSCCAC